MLCFLRATATQGKKNILAEKNDVLGRIPLVFYDANPTRAFKASNVFISDHNDIFQSADIKNQSKYCFSG